MFRTINQYTSFRLRQRLTLHRERQHREDRIWPILEM